MRDLSSDIPQTLIVAAQKGDCAAKNALFATVLQPVHSLARRLLGDHDAAEECCQEALTSAFRALGQFDPARGTFITWVFSITHNAATKKLRTRRCAHRSLHELSGAENITSSRERSPLEILMQHDEAQVNQARLDRIESRLPQKLRTGFRARRAGLTYRELAAAACVNENTARSWMFRSVHGVA